MKNRIVIWGTNAAEERVLIALELQTDVSKVMLYTFPESVASVEFVNKMMDEWRYDKEVEFPEGYTATERELSVTESLLPEDLKVERSDVIQRAQTEWHFVVLSTKLHQAYQQELAELKEKIEQISTYDNKLWDGLKSFWDKVQTQARERNLFRDHADSLRDNINSLFEDLKKVRTRVQDEFTAASSVVADEFNKALDEIEARIASGNARVNSIFDDLKQLQQRYRTARLSNEHRNQIWGRIDGAFKMAKERRFGPSANEGSEAERHDRRLSGLTDAIKRMEDSIRRDEEDLDFQQKKVNKTEGQLEAQIRMAKIKMIEERLASKRTKLDDMKRTMTDVGRRANAAKNKETKRAEKETEKQKIEQAKEAVRSEIESEIKSRSDAPGEENLFSAAATVLGDVLVDALDTARAVASVVSSKADDAVGDAGKKGSKMVKKAKAVANVVAEEAGKAFDKVMDKAEAALESFQNEQTAEKSDAPAETEKKDGIIIEDVVHKSEAEQPATADTATTTEKDGIIIEDVVHKEQPATADASEPDDKDDNANPQDTSEQKDA